MKKGGVQSLRAVSQQTVDRLGPQQKGLEDVTKKSGVTAVIYTAAGRGKFTIAHICGFLQIPSGLNKICGCPKGALGPSISERELVVLIFRCQMCPFRVSI